MTKIKNLILLFLLLIVVPVSSAFCTPVDLGQSGEAPSGNHTPDFHGNSLFTVGTWWGEFTRNVRSDAVDPTSTHLISMIGETHTLHVDFSSDSSQQNGDSSYGIPINVVADTTPLVNVIVDTAANGGFPNNSDCTGPGGTNTSDPCTNQLPIPANPSIENYYSATAPPSSVINDNNDHHMSIAVRSSTTGLITDIWELYQVWKDSAGWHTVDIAHWDMTTGSPRHLTWASADAAGLPIMPLMTRYDEYINGTMNHPIRVTLGCGSLRNAYVYPARATSFCGSSSDGIPFGARLRLTESYYQAHKNSYTNEARAVFDCMYNYGIINADVGGPMFISGVSDSRWNINNLLTLQNIPPSAFEVLQLHPIYNISGPANPAPGTTPTYTLTHYPSTDTNFSTVHYFYPSDGGINGDSFYATRTVDGGIGLDDTHMSQTFTFTVPATTPFSFTVDDSGDSEYPPPRFSLGSAVTNYIFSFGNHPLRFMIGSH